MSDARLNNARDYRICPVCQALATWDEAAQQWVWPCNCVGEAPQDDTALERKGGE